MAHFQNQHAAPQVEEYEYVIQTDEYGKTVRIDKYGNAVRVDQYGNPIRTDEYGNQTHTDECGNPVHHSATAGGYGAGGFDATTLQSMRSDTAATGRGDDYSRDQYGISGKLHRSGSSSSSSSVASVMTVRNQIQPEYAASMWNEASNKRLGTLGLSLSDVLVEIEKQGSSFDE